ncbi:MAG: hypothetical protein FJW88_10170 [Actinobacteria bacterium]|nr:hypothetical protein [Actinomycetota bacterium]
MTWLAAIWDPDGQALAELRGDGLTVQRALDDQGRYGAGRPFGVLLRGEDPVAPAALRSLGSRVRAWRVEEHAPRTATEACAVTMTALMRRHPDLDHAGFVEHWLYRHRPLALAHHEGLADYRQCVVVEALITGGEAGDYEVDDEVDGVARLGFATRADLDHRFYDSDEGRRVIGEDVRRFMAGPGPDTTLLGPPERVAAPG